MGTREEDLEKIQQFIYENVPWFCDPHPDGLGWPRPGGLPEFYLNNPNQYMLDLKRIQDLKRAALLREVAEASGHTASRRMAAETRELLDAIRKMHEEGRTPAAIAEALGIRERAVSNVLALGPGAYDPSASGAPVDPRLNAFVRAWGRDLQPGGSRNGNGNGHHKDGAL